MLLSAIGLQTIRPNQNNGIVPDGKNTLHREPKPYSENYSATCNVRDHRVEQKPCIALVIGDRVEDRGMQIFLGMPQGSFSEVDYAKERNNSTIRNISQSRCQPLVS